jgi:plastocyanin
MRRRSAIAALLTLLALIVASAAVKAQARSGPVEAVVTDERGKPVADAVVTLTSLGTPAPVTPRVMVVMDQHDKEFVPHVLPVYIGTPVSFPNRDNIRHHVYSFSSPKKFELPLYIGTPAAPILFDKPGVVALGCNIHDWMLAYIYVVTTPYFAKTAADGKARLDGLAPGPYEARVWQARMRGDTEKTAKPVTLAAGEPAQLAFVVSLKAEWRVPRAPEPYKGVQGS